MPRFVDELYAELFKRKGKSKTAPEIKKAYEALRAGRSAEVRARAEKIARDPLFLDLALNFEAETYLREITGRSKPEPRAVIPDSGMGPLKKAIALYQRIEVERPDSSHLKDAWKKIALAELRVATRLVQRKQHDVAREMFHRALQRLLDRGQLGLTPPDAIEAFAESCVRKIDMVCQAWVRRLARNSAKGSREIKALQKHFSNAVDYQSGVKGYERLVKSYKGIDPDDEAIDVAIKHVLDGNSDDAAEALEEFMKLYPKSQHRWRALYWLGRSLQAENEIKRANESFETVLREQPLSYYGILASKASGRPLEAYVDAILPKAVATDELLSPSEEMRLERAKIFVAHGEFDLAGNELKDLNSRGTLSNEFLVYLASLNFEIGNFYSAFRIISDLSARSSFTINSTYWLRLIFPVVHKAAVSRFAKQNQLDAILVLSLIKQESAFDSDAVSSAGAMGLMQLMPYTAVEVDPNVEQAQLLEPETNVRLGTAYLAGLLKRFNGNIALSLAGYNAGPARAATWSRESKPKWGMLEFIESIPFRETRGYVSSIIRNYFWYSYRLTGKHFHSFDYFWGVSGPTESPQDFPLDS